MPPEAHFDLASLDQTKVIADRDAIRRVNPQRYEMEHLDGVLHFDRHKAIMIGFKDVRADEFWVRGHMPGMPLLPGVIMCEAAAQLCSFFSVTQGVIEQGAILGFGGLEDVRFRGTVRPGDRLFLICKGERLKRRHSIFDVQGFVNGTMVFHGKVIGVPLEAPPEA
jgi:3-hydroxyacyl-[acyl-carrier-protein] dehydratase